MSELLNTAVARLQCMKGDIELLVHAFAGAVILAAAEDARATAAITCNDKGSLNAQRKAEDKKVALQLAWSEARDLAKNISDRLETWRRLQDRVA
ncbi:hypothetical protein HFN59_00535 [Rhizobium leguminosarum]|uniref:hypothetical protein n=1 Tax=Rhizobium leguminosarum TaxID=384 RepID=UPI001C977511|nr:hypothetical protein [Rhizobium leguminosarum]MBY5775615.1 hypothetical protein [Rhizobium leguminosarum]